jgi:type VI secretion system protein
MPLGLTITNCDSLPNGAPTRLELDRRGAILGRSPTVDWSLPDPASVISSRHAEITFRAGAYVLTDTSTNGTLVNSRPMTGPHDCVSGDVITIGHYEISVSVDGGSAPGGFAPAAEPQREWGGWDSHVSDGPVGVDPASWDKPKPKAAISGMGSMSAHMAPAAAMPASAPVSSGWGPAASPAQSAPAADIGWGQPPPPPPPLPSGWSSAIGDAPAPSTADDIWGKLADSNVVDWARGGFGQPQQATNPDPLGLAPAVPDFAKAPPPVPSAPTNPPVFGGDVPAQATPPPPAPVQQIGASLAPFFASLGISPDIIKSDDGDMLAAAGTLLHHLVAGMVVMLEARARAKSQMGAQSTALEFDGNNPIKFARTPEQALAQLLNPPERGFMGRDRAIEDAFFDLQSHQMATLKAMQGALRATLDRFSPSAIKARTEAGGLLSQIMPGARDAALWRAYEKEFGGVAQGSDEAFMDVFAKEFRIAYEAQAASRPRR